MGISNVGVMIITPFLDWDFGIWPKRGGFRDIFDHNTSTHPLTCGEKPLPTSYDCTENAQSLTLDAANSIAVLEDDIMNLGKYPINKPIASNQRVCLSYQG